MSSKNHNKPSAYTTIDGVQYRLCRVIDKTATNIHHIIGKTNANKYNVRCPKNKIRMNEREHNALNAYFKDKQSPREQFQKIYELTKQVLSEGVRKELYTILYEADDTLFYDEELLKGKQKKKKKSKD